MTGQPTDPTALPIFGGPDEWQDPQEPVRESPVGQIRPRRPSARSLAGRIAAQPASQAGAPVAPAPVQSPNPAPPVLAQPPSGAMSPWLGKVAPPSAPTKLRARAAPTAPTVEIDWHQVALFRAQTSERLVERLGDDKGKDLEAERELGKEIIQTLLEDVVADRLHDGEQVWRTDEQDALAKAIFDAVFGLGRLQPLVDDDTVENIIISGADNVWVEKTDGDPVSRVAPVADSDAELLDFLAFIASRSEVNARSFSPANPRLHMRLDGGARLAAAAWVTARPSVVDPPAPAAPGHASTTSSARDMLTATQASFLARRGQGRQVDRGRRPAGRRQDDRGPGALPGDPALGGDRHVRDRVRAAPARAHRRAPHRARVGGPPRLR